MVLYNSQNADSLAVRDAYIAAHPGVLEFDINNAAVVPGNISRASYLANIRTPLVNHLQGFGDGMLLSEQVVAIATTRGLPARIQGANEFAINSTFSSLESDLSLLQQDLEATGVGILATRTNGPVDNPYHGVRAPILAFNRSAITTQRVFQVNPSPADPAFWNVVGLTPGHMYLACRLDSAPSPGKTAVENTIALIGRSVSLVVNTNAVQSLFDEYPATHDQLDDNGFTAAFPAAQDFELASATIAGLGIDTQHDEQFNFVDNSEVMSVKPVLVYGTYGENHDINFWGEDPPGTGSYYNGYTFHPAAASIGYESFNGNSLINGLTRQGQGQAADFIADGGSFTICHVAEPFSFAVADMEELATGLYVDGRSFAEAAYIAIPAISWQNTPIGDPLATVSVVTQTVFGDLTGDGIVNGADSGLLLGAWGSAGPAADLNNDGNVDGADLGILLGAWTV
jgi:hypothetical protein